MIRPVIGNDEQIRWTSGEQAGGKVHILTHCELLWFLWENGIGFQQRLWVETKNLTRLYQCFHLSPYLGSAVWLETWWSAPFLGSWITSGSNIQISKAWPPPESFSQAVFNDVVIGQLRISFSRRKTCQLINISLSSKYHSAWRSSSGTSIRKGQILYSNNIWSLYWIGRSRWAGQKQFEYQILEVAKVRHECMDFKRLKQKSTIQTV